MSYESDKARLAQINEYLGLNVPPPSTAEVPGGLWARTGKQAANLPSNIAEDMMQGFQGMFNILTPKGGEIPLTSVPKPYAIANPTTFGESAVDVGAGLASLLPAALAPEIAVARGAQILGVGTRASRLLGSAVGWGGTGAPYGAEEAAIQGGLGVLGTAVDGTPMRVRAPLALAGGVAGYFEGARRSQTEGAIMGALNTVLPFAEPALHRVLNKTRLKNVTEASGDGAIITSAPPELGPSGLSLGGEGPLQPEPYGPGIDPSPSGMRLATLQNEPLQPQGGLPMFNDPDTSHLVIGQRGTLMPGWEQGAIPLTPPIEPDISGMRLVGQPASSETGLRLGEGPIPQPDAGISFYDAPDTSGMRLGGEGDISPEPFGPEQQFDPSGMGLAPTESNGIVPTPEPAPVATLQTEPPPPSPPAAKPKHFQEKFTPKQQALLKDSGFGEPRGLPTGVMERDAHALGARLKTKAEVNQLKNASKALEAEFDAALDSGNMDLANEVAMKQQFLNETIEFAEGMPGKLNTYLSRDPNYKPAVPGKEYLAAQKGEAPVKVKKGDSFPVKSGNEVARAGTVTKVSKGNIHYQVEDLLTGETVHFVSPAEEFATLQKTGEWPTKPTTEAPPSPKQPVEPAASKTPESPSSSLSVRVLENGKWVDGQVVGRDGTTVTVRVEDITGRDRIMHVHEDQVKPVATLQPTAVPKGGVPFQDVASDPTGELGPSRRKEPEKPASKLPDEEGDELSPQGESMDDVERILDGRDSPGPIGEDGQPIPWDDIPTIDEPAEKTAAYFKKFARQTLAQGARELEGLGGMLLKDLFARMRKAAGQPNFPVLFQTDPLAYTRAGRLNVASGEVQITWDHVLMQLRDWRNMSAHEQAGTMVGLTKLLGHELSHAAVRHGSIIKNLQINGRNLVDAIEHEVFSLPLTTRQFIQGELKEAIGETGIVSNYLAGDIKAVWDHYKKSDPTMTQREASKFAAEEFLVELMSAELHKRMDVKGLSGIMRAAVDRLKGVFKAVLRYFSKQKSEVAALQNLQDIAVRLLDDFGEATAKDHAKAYPSSRYWKKQAGEVELPHQKIDAPFEEPEDLSWITGMSMDMPAPSSSTTFLRNEMLRVATRTVGGAVLGGVIAPTVSKDQLTSAEGALLGGLMGAFGPAFAKHLLNSDIAIEAGRALAGGKGNPIKSLELLMQGKSLRQLGGEALFTTKNGAARFVRGLEISLGINFDPKLRSVLENSRGLVSEQLGMMYDAMKAAKDFKPSTGLDFATLQYLTGKLDQKSYNALLTTEEEKAFGSLITTARAGTDVLQDFFASGMKEGKFKQVVQASMGSYLGKFYTAYTKGEFNMSKYADAKADLKTAFPEYSDDVADSILHQHMREVQADKKMFGRMSSSGQQMDPNLWKRRLSTESEIEAQELIVSGMAKDDPDLKGAQEKLDFMRTHKITEGWAQWLGEVKDPKERILRTFQKLYASSITGKTFDSLSLNTDQFGNKFAYGAEELSKLTQGMEARLGAMSPSDPAFATLQNQLQELKVYVPLPSGAQYGKLSGKMVSRFVRDEIATDTSPFKWMEQPIFRAISSFNTAIKIGRTALNPITVIRNYMQMPMFGLIAKTNMTDLAMGWKEIKGRTDLHHVMLRLGITNADFTAAELADGPGKIFSGFFDTDAATRMTAKGFHSAMEFYRAPDMILRAGTFISAVRRFADGDLARGLADARITERAVEFTNRYTMNYHAVSKVIKVGRQLPFVSLFLSYTTEITRILKNLVEDAVSPTADSAGRMHALMVLGGMAALPALMVTAGEASLSPADKKEWDKIKALSPDYAKLRFRVPVGKRGDSFHYVDFTNLLPADAYTMMVRGIANGDYKAAAAVNPVFNMENTPLLNIATEQIMGKDLHTGQSLQGLDRVRQVLKEVLPPITPGVGYESQRILNAFTPNAQGQLGLTNIRTGRSIMPSDIVLNYLTGMKFGDVNPSAIQRGYIAEAKQGIATQQQLLRQVTATNVPEAVRKAAIERHNTAIKEIVFQMHEKLNLGNQPL